MSFPNFVPTPKQKRGHFSEADGTWILTAGQTGSGMDVTVKSALTVGAVFSCVKVLSESVASLPLITYRRLQANGKERARDHWLYPLLHDQPNRYQDSFSFWEMCMVNLCLRGNFYAQKLRNGAGGLAELYPLDPDRVKVDWQLDSRGREILRYVYNPPVGKERTFLPKQIFHVRGLTQLGMVGLSPIDQAKESIGLAMAAEQYGARYFSNAVRPSGVLQHPAKLSPEAAKKLRESWEETYTGIEKAHRVVVLEEGMEWKSTGLTNEQAQFLESRKFQRSEIASWFRVPPHMIGDLEKATFSNIEQQALDFVIHTLRPWLIRIEKAILTQLLEPEDRLDLYAEFLVDALLRGDLKTRMEAYEKARNMGLYSIDELRAKENENPLPNDWGVHHIEPLNMRVIGEEPEEEDEETDEEEETETDTDDEESGEESTESEENSHEATKTVTFKPDLRGIAGTVVGRIIRREAKLPAGDTSKFGHHLSVVEQEIEPWIKDEDERSAFIRALDYTKKHDEETRADILSNLLVAGVLGEQDERKASV